MGQCVCVCQADRMLQVPAVTGRCKERERERERFKEKRELCQSDWEQTRIVGTLTKYTDFMCLYWLSLAFIYVHAFICTYKRALTYNRTLCAAKACGAVLQCDKAARVCKSITEMLTQCCNPDANKSRASQPDFASR